MPTELLLHNQCAEQSTRVAPSRYTRVGKLKLKLNNKWQQLENVAIWPSSEMGLIDDVSMSHYVLASLLACLPACSLVS